MSTAVSTLLELQQRFRRAVLAGDNAEISAAIEGDGLDPAARLRIYANHASITLGAALKATFPVVCRLVDERFFAFAAHEYVIGHPPRSRCLSEYGDDFPDFLASFAPCKDLPYLADVARFEWALNIASTVREAPPLPIGALAAVPADRAGYVECRLQPSVRYITSPWPIAAIWQADQEKEVPLVALDDGGTSLEVRRAGETVAWRLLDPGTFAFRTALAEGRVLAAAIATATQKDHEFDVAAALQRLFAEGLAVDFSIHRDAA